MDTGNHAFHQLPLVNFNGYSDKFLEVSDEIKTKSYKDPKEKQSSKTNIILGKYPKCTKTKNASSFTFKKRLRSPLTATNCRLKRLFLGKSTSISSFELNNIKRSSNLHHSGQKCSLYGVISEIIKQKVSKLLKLNADKTSKQRKELKTKQATKEKNRVDSIKVLFDAKNSKNRKRSRKRNVLNDYRRLDLFYNSKSSTDGNRFRYGRRCTPKVCYQLLKCKSNSFLLSHKCRDENYEHDFSRNSETNNKNMNGDKFSPVCDCSTPVHYKLVDFSCNNIYKCLDLKKSLSRKCNCKSPVVIHQPRINRGVTVTTSCFNCKNGAGDSAECRHIAIPKSITSNNKIKEKGDSCVNNKIICKRRRRICKPKLSAHAIYFSNSYFISLIKSALKIFLLSFAIIAWSPCIVSVCVYWLITYPLRPQHIFTQAKMDACECGSCFKHSNEFWHIIFHSIVRALEKVGHVYNALCFSIKNQKPENTDILNPNRNSICKHRKLHMCANPKKKYTLYYTRHRGWIMKPTKKHRNRKHNKVKSFSKDGPEPKLCKLNKNKRCPRICQIGVQGTSTSTKKSPYIKISKKRHIEGKQKRNLKTYLSKMISTRSSPLLINTNSLIKARSVSNTCFESTRNMSIPFIRENNTYEQNYLGRPYFKESLNGNVETNNFIESKHKCENVQYNTCVSSHLNANLDRRKYLEYFPCKYRYTGSWSSKRRSYWTPCSCSSRRILSQNYPYSKISFVKPSKQKIRTKNYFISVPLNNQRKYKHYTCDNKIKNLTIRQKVFNYCKTALKSFRCMVRNTDTEVWTSDICNDMYISTLRNKPWFWVYKTCPSFYPYFLIFCKFNQNVAQCFLFLISTCFWCPIMCCCYFCYSLFCKCVC